MAVIWCGGEDIDFPRGAVPQVSTSVLTHRTSYSRCAIYCNVEHGFLKSVPFAAQTSAWLRAYIRYDMGSAQCYQALGFGKSGTDSGIFIGATGGVTSKIYISIYDGTTATVLATSSEYCLSFDNNYILDMEVVNFGAGGTVNVYINSVLKVTFTGDIAGTLTDFDSVYNGCDSPYLVGMKFSEAIVADEDTRNFTGLYTLYPTADGTTTDWTGAYTDVDEIAYSDVDLNYTSTADLDQQFEVNDLLAGLYTVEAVKIAARATKTAASPPTKLALGINQSGSITVGSDKTLTSGYDTYEEFFLTSPATSAKFTVSEVNALQLDVRSKA